MQSPLYVIRDDRGFGGSGFRGLDVRVLVVNFLIASGLPFRGEAGPEGWANRDMIRKYPVHRGSEGLDFIN
jgi:hypothetical protein